MNIERLKELRKERNFTQAETAEILEISLPAYRNYERGLREPASNILKRMADIFSCSTDYLVGNSAFKNERELQETTAFMNRFNESILYLDEDLRSFFMEPIFEFLHLFKEFKGNKYLVVTKLGRFMALYLNAMADLTDDKLQRFKTMDSAHIGFTITQKQMYSWVNDFIEWLEDDFDKVTLSSTEYYQKVVAIMKKNLAEKYYDHEK